MREFDFVIFGATGVTGKHVIKEAHRLARNEKKWAVAGRSLEKLKYTLLACGKDLSDKPIVIVDVENPESVKEMCKRCTLVINCVGPYRFYGEPIVKACVENGTHHIDVSGEPHFLEEMQLKYHRQAEKNGSYVVGACGFDSIPSDMGVEFMKDKFQGDLNSVEGYISFSAGPAGYKVNTGTWKSAIHGVGNAYNLIALRKELLAEIYPNKMPRSNHKVAKRIFFKSGLANGWCIPFLGSDKSVVLRSQMSNYDLYKDRPVQYQPYVRFPSLLITLLTMMMGLVFLLFASNRPGRWMLENYPGLFSLGVFKEGGPTEEQMKGASMELILVGKGWSDKMNDPSDKHQDPPNQKMVAKITGPDPGYVLTSTCLVLSALTILREPNKLPPKGGVYTTATAFSRTNLIQELNSNGIRFQIIQP